LLAVRKRSLLAERLLAPAEAAVHEHRRLTVSPGREVQAGLAHHAASLTRAQPAAAASNCGPSDSKSDGCRRSAAKKASTTWGANCVPRPSRTSAAAASTVNAGR